MGFKKISGTDFERMVKAGLHRIGVSEVEINSMNVFPVPDGDTGTNLRMTLQNGVESARSNPDLGKYVVDLKKGMLLGARGNSGVILSQIFSGICSRLCEKSESTVDDFFQALVVAYEQAYSTVINPVEGTLLTVARLGIENIRGRSFDSIESLLESYIKEMTSTLSITPELLPVLKESGVLDSGGAGYILIVEGMYQGLLGKDFASDDSINHGAVPSVKKNLNTDCFTGSSKFVDGYCTEFILQLMDGENYDHSFNMEDFIENLKGMGNSIVAFLDGSRVKVHIHTLKPYRVIELAQNYGEFVTFKMDNMQIQHNQHDMEISSKKNNAEKKSLSVIAVVNGEGVRDLYSGFGCDIIIEGGSTMNTSSKEFIESFESLNAEQIVVLPNNKNIFMAAKQAVEISGKKNIEILETENVLEGYYALAMSQFESSNTKEKIEAMVDGLNSVSVFSITVASRNYVQAGAECVQGDYICFHDGKLLASSEDFSEMISETIKLVPEILEKESCIVLCGKSCTDDLSEIISDCLEKNIPGIEINFVDGGQDIYHFIIGF